MMTKTSIGPIYRKRHASFFMLPALGVAALATLAPASHAEVKSLSSSELTETYIEDSTIIITPKRKKSLNGQKTISSVTIAPYEGDNQGLDTSRETDESQATLSTSFELSDELMRNTSVEQSLLPTEDVYIPSYTETITRPVADILDDERYRPPEGDFDFSYVGDDLGLSRNGDEVTFSIGNIPGIDQINLPNGINDGPIELIPRPGGGFDLTIAIPEQTFDPSVSIPQN